MRPFFRYWVRRKVSPPRSGSETPSLIRSALLRKHLWAMSPSFVFLGQGRQFRKVLSIARRFGRVIIDTSLGSPVGALFVLQEFQSL